MGAFRCPPGPSIPSPAVPGLAARDPAAEGRKAMTAGAENPIPEEGPGTLDVMSLAGEGGRATPGLIRELLREVIDPEIGINIVDLGLVYDVALSGDGGGRPRWTLPARGAPLAGYIEEKIKTVWGGGRGVAKTDGRVLWN